MLNMNVQAMVILIFEGAPYTQDIKQRSYCVAKTFLSPI